MASIFGESSTSFHGVESHTASLLIFIFTGVTARVLVLSGSEVDTFLILLLVLFLWIVIRNAMQSVSDATRITALSGRPHNWMPPGSVGHHSTVGGSSEGEGWAENWAVWMDFVSRVLVLLTFQVAGQLILQEWILAGVTTQETLVLLFLIAIIFFPIFLWVHRTWTAHGQREREDFRRSIEASRAHHATTSSAPFRNAFAGSRAPPKPRVPWLLANSSGRRVRF